MRGYQGDVKRFKEGTKGVLGILSLAWEYTGTDTLPLKHTRVRARAHTCMLACLHTH